MSTSYLFLFMLVCALVDCIGMRNEDHISTKGPLRICTKERETTDEFAQDLC